MCKMFVALVSSALCCFYYPVASERNSGESPAVCHVLQKASHGGFCQE